MWRGLIKTVPYSSLGQYNDDKNLMLSIWNIAVFQHSMGFWGTIMAHKSPQWPHMSFSSIHSLRRDNLQQNDKLYCWRPESDSGDQDFTSRNHFLKSRLSPLKGFGSPIIKGTGLNKLILMWRCFIMAVHIVVWVIKLMIRLCCSIYHEILVP